ncbi:MAG: fumarylacetoacetate hydrolase family protein [Phycicoccus sp.]
MTHLVRYRRDRSEGVGTLREGRVRELPFASMGDALALTRQQLLRALRDEGAVVPDAVPLAPVDGRTEIWASGVTYERSRDARIEEATVTDVYELVYDAARPELFFKSPAWRVRTTGETIGIRSDSELNVPEPELGLVCNAHGEIVGFVVVDDVSSRSIEGANPLYLPQAKTYAGACAISAGVRIREEETDVQTFAIDMEIVRDGVYVYRGHADTSEMVRGFDELVGALFAADHFPEGVVLSTGTGVVPPIDVTLAEGDDVRIVVAGVGALENRVVRGKESFRTAGSAA